MNILSPEFAVSSETNYDTSIPSPICNNSLNSSSPETLIKGESLDFICLTHEHTLDSCDNCCDRLVSGFLKRKKNAALLKKIQEEQESTEKIKAELELLKMELNDLCQVNKIPAAFNPGDLHRDLYSRPLPKSFFSICETSETSLSFMMKLNIFPNNPKCIKCDQIMKLQGRGGLGFAFKCFNCKSRRDYKAGTFWEKINLQPNQIL